MFRLSAFFLFPLAVRLDHFAADGNDSRFLAPFLVRYGALNLLLGSAFASTDRPQKTFLIKI